MHAIAPPPVSPSASAGHTHDVIDRESTDLVPLPSGFRPAPFSHEYHVVGGENEASGFFTTGPVDTGSSVEVSMHEQPRRPRLGPVGGRAGMSLTESTKRAPEPHSQLPPSQKADIKRTPKIGPVVGSGDIMAFKDDGNPSTGAGADNPGGSLFSLH